MIGMAAVSFPSSLIAAALPEIANEFHTRNSVMAWVSIAPAIAFSITMPMFGKIGDLYGHRRVYIVGFAVSTALSLLTAFVPNVAALIALRTASQLFGTSTIPSSFAMIALVYPPDERPKVFGRLSAVLAASPVLAVVFGGPLVELLGWRVVFVAQAIPSAIGVVVARRILPETPLRPDVRFDIRGSAALAVTLTGLLLFINRLEEWGLRHPVVLACLFAFAAGLPALMAIERRAPEPLLPLPYFRRRNFTLPVLTMGLTQAGWVGASPLTAYLFGQRFGYGTFAIALLSSARPLAFALGSAVADRSAAHVGGRVVQGIGNAATALSGVFGAFGVWHQSVLLVLVSSAASGFGVGFARPGVVTAVNNAVDANDVGIANGVNNMAGQIGGSTGTTLLLAWVGTSTDAHSFAAAYLTSSVLGVSALASGQFIEHRKPDRAVPQLAT